jgi:hypothetical protein
VVVRDFNIVRISIGPPEADSILIVDTYAMLTSAIALQRLQPIPREYQEIVEFACGIDHPKLLQSPTCATLKRPTRAGDEQALAFAVAERLDQI